MSLMKRILIDRGGWIDIREYGVESGIRDPHGRGTPLARE